MKMTKLLIVATSAATLAFSASAFADDKATVQKFYDFLSNPGSQSHAQAFRANVASDWQSIGDYSGKSKSADGLIGQMSGFAKLVPDLNWKVEEMIQAGDRIIVRGRASGTPKTQTSRTLSNGPSPRHFPQSMSTTPRSPSTPTPNKARGRSMKQLNCSTPPRTSGIRFASTRTSSTQWGCSKRRLMRRE